jgi:hypothetical protein
MISATKRGAAPVEPVGAGNGAGAPTSNQPAPDGRWAGLVAAGRLDPAALRSAACPICATEWAHLRATGCCISAICAGCIGTTVRAKAEAASQLVVEYLGKAHQCPRCGHGPVEHFACGDRTAHDVGHNK